MESIRIPAPNPELLERDMLADSRIFELLRELEGSVQPVYRYFHALFSLLMQEDPAKFYSAFSEGYETSFANVNAQQNAETELPGGCEHALRLLMRECADCRTFVDARTFSDCLDNADDSVFAFGADLIYKELALEVWSYVCEVLEGSPDAYDKISGEVILEKIASMHLAYDPAYIEHRYDSVFKVTPDIDPDTIGYPFILDGDKLWKSFCEDPESFYCGLPFDPQAHEHVMQKIAEHPEENRYSDVIAYLLENACGQTVGFNGNIVKLPFFLKALSEIRELPFRVSFYAVEYHPALYAQGFGGLYTKLSEDFLKQRRADAQFLQKYLPADRIRKQIEKTENRRKQSLETLHIVKL